MKHNKANSGFEYVIRLDKGERIFESLLSLAQKEGFESAFFYGIGAVKNTTLGRRNDETKEYEYKEFPKTLELASMNGNLSRGKDGLILHIHAVLGDEKLNAIAGHLKEAEVAVTCEIFMQVREDLEMRREFDERTGLNLLNFN